MNDEARIEKITDSLNRDVLTSLPVVTSRGGAIADNYNQLLDIAKTMSTARFGVPAHLRGNPGDCLAIRELSLNTGLSAYGLAQHCYIVNDMLCYDAQVIHAIIEKHAPITKRLRFTFQGEGDTRTCTVSGTFKDEAEPCEYTTPELRKITPQNSPLWKSDPDQQLTYFGSRRWGRRFCPDILLGVFSRDEIEDNPHVGADNAKVVSPNLMERLPGKIEGAGFAHDVVQNGLDEKDKKAAKKSEAKDEADPVTEAAKTVEAAMDESETLPLPKNLNEYTQWVNDWLSKYSDPDQIGDRWRSERKLRNACGLVSDESAKIKAKVDAKLAKLK
jgi:hypothetical protein